MFGDFKQIVSLLDVLKGRIYGWLSLYGNMFCSPSLVRPGPPDDHEDVHEELDHVQVDVEGGEDVLLGGQRVLVLPAEHQLRVVDKVEGEH